MIGIKTNNYLSNTPTNYTDANLPLDPTNTLIVEQGGAYKKVAVSEVGGTSKFDFQYDSVVATASLPFNYVAIKEYNIGKLSELLGLNFFLTVKSLSVAGDMQIKILDSLNNSVYDNYVNLPLTNSIYNIERKHIIIDNTNSLTKFIDTNAMSDTNAIGTWAYVNRSFSPTENYRLNFGVRVNGASSISIEQVSINFYKI